MQPADSDGVFLRLILKPVTCYLLPVDGYYYLCKPNR